MKEMPSKHIEWNLIYSGARKHFLEDMLFQLLSE